MIMIFDKNATSPFTSGVLLGLDYKQTITLLIADIRPFSTLVHIRVPPGLPLSPSIIPVYYPLAELVKPI
jgi:hypothetical protein